MRHVYAPGLGRVVSKAQERLAGDPSTYLSSAVRAAAGDLARVRAAFDEIEPTVLRSHASVERAVSDVRTCFGLVFDALEQMGTAADRPMPAPPPPDVPPTAGPSEPLLAGALDALVGAVSELWQSLDVLACKQAAEEVQSPFPTLNHCLKTGLNVYDGHVDPTALDLWIPRSEEVAGALSRQISRFAALHPEAPALLVETAAALVTDVSTGLGAMRVYREAGDPVALLDGLRLVRHGSERLCGVLEAIDRAVRASATWSALPALDELCRALQTHAGDAIVGDCLDSTENLLRFHETQCKALRALPLSYTVTEQIVEAEAAVARARACFEALQDGARDAASLRTLCDAFHATQAARDACVSRLEREMDSAALSSHLEELKELSGRFLLGAISEPLLRERVVAWLKDHAMLEMQVREAARSALGSDAAELLALLHQQGEGIEETTRFFRDGDPRHLSEGFRRMEEPLAGLAAMRERVVRALRPATGVAAEIRCFGCDAPNDARRTHCAACGVALPAIARALASTADEAVSGGPVPRNLWRIQRVVEAYEQHQASPADIQYEAALYLGRLGHIRRDFERRFVPRLRSERNPALINMARDFYESLTDLQSGLLELLAFGDHLRPDSLYRGLQSCTDAGQSMQGAQARIEEVLELL